MDFLIEFLGEIVFEGIFLVATNKKVPWWLRYPVLLLVVLVYVLLIGGLFLVGVKVVKSNLFGGIIIFLLDIFVIVITIIGFKKKLLENKNN